MALNPRQELFVLAYLKDPNATTAAIAAGYSPKTAQQIGSRLLSHVVVAAAIDARREKRAKKLELSAELVLENIMRLGGKAEQVGELPAALKAQELLGKHLKLFTDKVETSGSVTIVVRDPYAGGGE